MKRAPQTAPYLFWLPAGDWSMTDNPMALVADAATSKLRKRDETPARRHFVDFVGARWPIDVSSGGAAKCAKAVGIKGDYLPDG
ncbi:hypothetical protein KCP77_03270 [Salmonella enterica subsp. enterica]|nr:hypothetical protein KCP77_03270 [Salmonella enterica subsp. enterica]